jgi:mRNA interferase YafQ
MRTIERTGQFKRDFKRESKGQHRLSLQSELTAVIVALANDQALDPRHRDHGLTGDWKDHRDCHIKPDLVLATAVGAPGLSQRTGALNRQASAESRCP